MSEQPAKKTKKKVKSKRKAKSKGNNRKYVDPICTGPQPSASTTNALKKAGQLPKKLPARASKEEIAERRTAVKRLRLRGLGYRSIAKIVGVGHMTIKRDLEAIRHSNKTRVTMLDQSEHVGESLSVFEEVELRAWQDYHDADKGSQQRQRFLAEIQSARQNQTKLLMDLGVINRVAERKHITVSTEVISGWTPDAQDLVALAILKSQMKPLLEPRQDEALLAPKEVIDVEESEVQQVSATQTGTDG